MFCVRLFVLFNITNVVRQVNRADKNRNRDGNQNALHIDLICLNENEISTNTEPMQMPENNSPNGVYAIGSGPPVYR